MKNTFVKVLSFLMALTMIVGAFGTTAVFAADECAHTKGQLIETVAPTCNALGFSRYTCGECGEEWVTDVVQPSENYHNYVDSVAVEASCLTNAISAGKKCSHCGKVLEGCVETAGSQLKHQFVGAEVTATCTTEAKFVYTCKLCGKTAEWLNGDNDAKKNYFTAGQSYDEWKAVVTGPALDPDHNNIKWSIVTAPVSANGACTDGLAKGVCEKCGKEVTATIPVVHDYSVNLNPTGASCAEYKSGYKCKVCGKIQDGAVKNDADKIGKHEIVKRYTGKFVATSLPTKYTGASFTLQELYDRGFNVGDDFYKAATCKAAGSQLVECKCGEIYVETIAVKDHSYGAWSEINWPTDCTKPAVRERVCSHGCETKETQTIAPAAATAHTLKVEVTAPTCTAIGFTTTTCTNTFVVDGVTVICGHDVVDSHVDATGHAWGAATYVSGTCGSAVYQQACTNKDCKVTRAADEPDANKAHVFAAEVTVAATCEAPSFKRQTCTICKYNKDTAIEGAKVDPNNHVYTEKLGEDGKPQYVGAAPTCTTTATVIIWCRNTSCDQNATITTKTTALADHNLNANYIAVNSEGKNVPGYGALAATCQAVGYKDDGDVCSVCLYVKTAATVIEKNPNSHSGTVTVVSTSGATCKDGAYNLTNTSCCGLVKTYTGDGKPVACSYTVTVPYTAPTCTAAGNHQYTKCVWCGTKKAYSTVADGCTFGCTEEEHTALVGNDNHVIAALGHDYKKVDAVPAVACDKTGTAEYYDCARCNYVKVGNTEYDLNNADQSKAFDVAKTVPAHYNAYQVTMTAVAATCSTDGVKAGTYCRICDKDEWVISKNTVSHVTKTIKVNLNDSNAPIDCTAATCIVTTCKNCTYSNTVYTAAKNSAHKMPNDWTEIQLEAGKPTCKNDIMESKKCSDCEYTVKQVKTPASGCYTTKGVANGTKYYIDYSCNKIAEFIGWSCDVCLDTVDMGDVTHEVVTSKQDATCTADGFEIKYCKNCNYNDAAKDHDYTKTTTVIMSKGYHVLGTIVERVEAQIGADGYIKYICADCKETITDVLEAPHYLTTNVVTDAKVVAAGATIQVTITASADALKFNELTVAINTNGAFKVVAAEMVATLEGNVHVDANNTSFYIYTENDATGAPTFTTLDGENVELVTLTLVANEYVNGDVRIDTTAVAAVTSIKADGTKVSIALTDNGTHADVKVATAGNLNGDNVIGITDIQMLIPMITNGTTDATADVNRDGEINLYDVAALRKFVASKQNVLDYIEMIGEDLDAAIAAVKVPDMDNDGDSDANDAILFNAYIVNEFEEADYTDYLTVCGILDADSLVDVIEAFALELVI